MSLPPQNAVNKGYDALPSRSAKFNTGWDTPYRWGRWTY